MRCFLSRVASIQLFDLSALSGASSPFLSLAILGGFFIRLHHPAPLSSASAPSILSFRLTRFFNFHKESTDSVHDFCPPPFHGHPFLVQVPCPKTPVERRVLLVGGVLNILVPCGLGSIFAGFWLRDNQLISTGVLQLVLTLLAVGIVWSIAYGCLMLMSAFTVSVSSPPSQPPLPTDLTPSGRMPSSSLQYQYEPQKSHYHNHAYTSLSPARVTGKSLVLAMEETKAFSPTSRPPAPSTSGPVTKLYAKEEEYSADATLVA